MKKSLIMGIILLIVSIGLIIKTEISKKNINYTNIHDITNTGSKLEGVYVSLDATYVAGIIANDKDNSYYVMFGDGVQYIVYINNNKANEVRKYLLDNPDESYKITGITKMIPTSLEEPGKKFVHEWLDRNHTHDEETKNHSHDITTEEFYEYFGYVYFDTTIYSNILNKVIIIITSLLGIVCVFYYINTKYHLL